jgi:UDP-galactopyranose mutase
MTTKKGHSVTIVGCGFFGSTLARILAEQDFTVKIIEARNHIGGNSIDYIDEQTGILVHKYGTHVFHTSNRGIWTFVNRFSEFIEYEHRVKARVDEKFYTLPFNLNTFEEIYAGTMNEDQISELISRNSSKREFLNLEDYCIDRVGLELYETLIKGYTTKQWGMDPRNLPPEIIQRIAIRNNRHNGYFSDTFQGLPKDGYGKLFERMLNHPNISVELNSEFILEDYDCREIFVYSGPLDKLFNYEYGVLDWRCVDLELEVLNLSDYQGLPVVNYPDIDVGYTRIHEFKHLYPKFENTTRTIVAKEYSRKALKEELPYYPVRTIENISLYQKYLERAGEMDNFYPGGRLGSFMYLDMHMAIGQAMKIGAEILGKK